MGKVNIIKYNIFAKKNIVRELDSKDNRSNVQLVDDIEAWANGADGRIIQHIFPNMSADDREFLLTGSTPEDWNTMFKEEDEEDE